MAKSFKALRDQVMADPARRERVETGTRALRLALALAAARERRGVTQATVADAIGTSQANVSRIESEQDVYLSTLARYVAALGGRLEVAAIFPDETIVLAGEEPSNTEWQQQSSGAWAKTHAGSSVD
jgi:DNA-binding XRE family transcriptional regulator